MTPSTPTFTTRLSDAARAVEAGLEALLSDKAAPGEIARPPRLMAAMRHAALGSGKRLRPFLTVETARLLGM
jgi:farnesyl diphosphate synthase